MRIGDFARLGNVSVANLAFSRSDRIAGCEACRRKHWLRRYDVQQLTDLRQIRVFQDLGFSLSQIRTVSSPRAAFLPAACPDGGAPIRDQAPVREDVARLARIERLCAFGQASVFPHRLLSRRRTQPGLCRCGKNPAL